jgi:CxxC motif-containing protein (DUF1111 family)
MASSSKFYLLLSAGVLLGACETQPESVATNLGDEPVAVIPAEVTPELQLALASRMLGDPLQRLTADERARFAAGLEEFSTPEEADEGLGPVFNEDACIVCHTDPVGGTTGRLETRFGRRGNNGKFDPLANLGGSLLQDHAIGRVADGFKFFPERVPRGANVVASRMTTPLFGLGLVDAVPDQELIGLAQRQPRDVRGIANVLTDIATGETRVGRFGWKAQVATLQTFSGDAYLNEMGITSPNFPNENCPQGDCTALAHNPVPAVNDTGNGVTAFKDFMTLLAPPQRGSSSQLGEDLFKSTGCATCHTPKLATGPSPVAALDRKVFEPFSDFLLHDMGRLGDGIVQGNATGRLMRTAPLWGAHARPAFLHDGRATTIAGAILAHDGQGRAARQRFDNLSFDKKRALVAYVNSL